MKRKEVILSINMEKRKAPMTKMLNGRRVKLCDYYGTCTNMAYREVYQFLLKGKLKREGWSYLCRKHFGQEQKRLKKTLPYSTLD